MEHDVGGRVGVDHRGEAQPVLGLAGDADLQAVAADAEAHHEVAAVGIEGAGLALLNLHQRLCDADDGDVDQLDGAVVGGLRTLDGEDVACSEAPAVSAADGIGALAALLVVGAVDVDASGLVFEIPVAILVVGVRHADARHAVGLGVGAGDDLGAGGDGHLGDALDDVDALRLSVAEEQHLSGASHALLG